MTTTPTPDPNRDPAQDPVPGTPGRRLESWAVLGLLLAVAMVGGFFVLKSYRSLHERQVAQQRPPLLYRLEDNLTAVERSGETVELKDLKGKVLLVGHVYTRCPRGCSGVAELMEDFQQRYGDNPDFHLISFSVDPAHDDPAQLSAFTEQHGIEGDNWWFLTGDEDEIRDYLVSQFKFQPVRDIPQEERLNEFDLFAHDMRVALVDDRGHIRGYYEIFSSTHGDLHAEKLDRDLRHVLREAEEND